MTKSELRKSAISELKNIDIQEKKAVEQNLTEQLVQSDFWICAETIGITISQNFEWNTRPIIEAAWDAGKKVCVPKCQPSKKLLTFYKFESYDQLETVYYNLLEPKPREDLRVVPSEIDLLIVPGVLFDRRGFRIGFGGGYYDRFLSHFPNNSIALASSKQVIDQLPTDAYDQPVQHLITERGLIK